MHSGVPIIPRGYSFTGLTPDGMNGRKWKAKYGVVGIDADGEDYLSDGMNEEGLTVGLFYLPGFTRYPDYEIKQLIRSQQSASQPLSLYSLLL